MSAGIDALAPSAPKDLASGKATELSALAAMKVRREIASDMDQILEFTMGSQDKPLHDEHGAAVAAPRVIQDNVATASEPTAQPDEKPLAECFVADSSVGVVVFDALLVQQIDAFEKERQAVHDVDARRRIE
jgi:hypothetical protein